jgi:hypothetical protein
MDTSVSEEDAAFILTVDPEDGGSMFLQKPGIHLEITVSHSEDVFRVSYIHVCSGM